MMEAVVMIIVGKILAEPQRFLPRVAALALAFSVFAGYVLITTESSGSAGKIVLIGFCVMAWLFVANLGYRARVLGRVDSQPAPVNPDENLRSAAPLLWAADLNPYAGSTNFQLIAATSDGLLIWKVASMYSQKMLAAVAANGNPSVITAPTLSLTWDKVVSMSTKNGRLFVQYRDLGGNDKTVKFEASPAADKAVIRLTNFGWEVSGVSPNPPDKGKPVFGVIAFVLVATGVIGALFFAYSHPAAKVALAAVWAIGVPLLSWAIWNDKPVHHQKLQATPVSPSRPQQLVRNHPLA